MFKIVQMKLKIFDTKTIGELQDKFNECFPGFHIAFYKNQHALKRDLVANSVLTIADISKKHKNGELQIKSTSASERIIENFKMKFNLLVKIYRLQNGGLVPLPNTKTLTQEGECFNTKNSDPDNLTVIDEEIRLSL